MPSDNIRLEGGKKVPNILRFLKEGRENYIEVINGIISV